MNSLECKAKTIGSTPNINNILDAEVVVPLKYLSKFWRSLDLPLIKCEIKHDLKWIINFVKSEISRIFRVVNPNYDPVESKVVTRDNWRNVSNKYCKVLCFRCYVVC